jgi:hypothetical protein
MLLRSEGEIDLCCMCFATARFMNQITKQKVSEDKRRILTTVEIDGINANMKAELLLRSKEVLSDGAILEMVIWKLPEPVPGCNHFYKYRLYYGKAGVRIVGFDNERPKGDHCHVDGNEKPYQFTDVDQLVSDFLAAVQSRRK